ncbi:MAG TPA: GAF domain-containing protein, partial [Candidatus Ozemobacteraceae bacterium]|nr:GAF domain-containing protein [Candidatus Ozemobacteraceae bacterium]
QELLQAEGATLYLVDSIEKLMISQVILSDRVEEIVLNIDNTSIAGFTALNRQSLNIPDAYGDLSSIHPQLKFNRAIDQAHNFRTRNILTFPIIIKEDLIGVFQIINRKDGTFGDNDKLLLKNFAVLSGIAILNARLVERVVDEQEISRGIIEYTSDEVYIQHRDGRLLHCNRKAQEKIPEGQSLQSIKNKPLLEVFPALSGLQREVQKVIENNLDKAFSGGKMPYVILSAKNSRGMVEKVIIIIKVHSEEHETGIPMDSQRY